MRRFILITGPTASGKSDLSIRLAKELKTEVISADSVQVYKGFNIGSGKITKEESRDILHHLIDIKEPYEDYSAADFFNAAMPIIDRLNGKGKIPIICGGTALYIHSLLYDLNLESKPNRGVREKLNRRYEQEGLAPLVEMLEKKDADFSKKVDLKNPRRVIRALERLESGHIDGDNLRTKRKDVDAMYFILHWDRDALYERINKRVLEMVDAGLFEEVKALYDTYGDVKPMGAIGYKEVVKYLNHEWSKEEAIQKIQQYTRNFAKRQLTWFRREEEGIRIEIEADRINEIVENILEQVRLHYDVFFKHHKD